MVSDLLGCWHYSTLHPYKSYSFLSADLKMKLHCESRGSCGNGVTSILRLILPGSTTTTFTASALNQLSWFYMFLLEKATELRRVSAHALIWDANQPNFGILWSDCLQSEVQTVNSSRNTMFVLFELLLRKLMLSLGIHSFN